jgi:hypothetical protein
LKEALNNVSVAMRLMESGDEKCSGDYVAVRRGGERRFNGTPYDGKPEKAGLFTVAVHWIPRPLKRSHVKCFPTYDLKIIRSQKQ